MKHSANTIIIIVGPTAVGKTSLSLQLAQELNTSIISADSRQCFKELNIGVAKPSEAELLLVKHYFINTHSVLDDVNAAVFEQYALQKTEEIFRENDFAVMAGGTGLYVKAFCEGMDIIPQIPNEVRDSIIAKYQSEGIEYLQKELQQNDPAFWKIAEQKNPQRLMRALEVLVATGKSITEYRKENKTQRNFKIKKIGLELSKEKLHCNINKRADEMMENGLPDEAKFLQQYQHLNALQTVGYKELFDYFDGKISFQKAVDEIKKNTRQYAKRQMTWFKKDKEIEWFDADENILKKLLQ